jgi:mono/diheme cytochrome c family protein
MISRLMSCVSVVSLIAALCAALTAFVRAAGPDVGTEAQRQSGKTLYLRYCSQCHGEKGDGEGYAASHLRPRPRNFTTGKFKVRTTPNGALPTHQDLVNIIRRGMPYTSMPAWPDFSDQQVSDLAYFLTSFSAEFSNPENTPQPISLPSAPKSTKESIELGKKVYEETGCAKCHGPLGRGDGPSAPTLKDDWDNPIRAADLTQNWTFRGGSSREDIFRTLSTGLNGTPMPSFVDALKPEQRWALTDFIVSLSGGTNGPGYSNLVVAKHVKDPIDLAKGAANFAAAPVARFPIIGQIMQPGRSFHPPATSVLAQAIYDADSIALLVRWHDMSAQKTGTNGPSLPVAPEEEEERAGAAGGGGGAGGGSVFGDAEVAPTPAGQAQNPFAEPEAAPAGQPSEFSDAVAVQIPSQVPAGARKPYFIFGDAQNSVDLWFFDLARPDPVQFIARGSGDVAPKNTSDLTGIATYDQGEWSVIFKRPRRVSSGATFSPGEFMPVAFSVWDGFSRERGKRRGLSLWYSIYVESETVPSALGPILKTVLLILAIELIVIGWVRRSRARGNLGGDRRQQPATSV